MDNILLIEDDAFLVKMCVRHLKRADRIIRTAKNGREGMEELQKKQPDLLLLDLLMPQVDGFSVLDYIREKGYSFPVIILSNITWNFDKEGCKKIGATDYFIKSDIDIPALVKKIEKYLPSGKTAVAQ